MDLPLMQKRIDSIVFCRSPCENQPLDLETLSERHQKSESMMSDTGHRLSMARRRLSWCSTYSVSVAFPTSCTGRNCCDVSGFTSLVREDFVASLSPKVRGESVPHWKINSRNRYGIGKSSTNWWVMMSPYYHARPEHYFLPMKIPTKSWSAKFITMKLS